MKTSFMLFVTIVVSTTVAVPLQRALNDQTLDDRKVQTPEAKMSIFKPDCNKKPLKKSTDKDKSGTEVKDPSLQESEFAKKKARKQKAIFVNYRLPDVNALPRVPKYPKYEEPAVVKQYPESSVYYIKLPPSPYVFVPGFGYISQPPSYSFPKTKKPLRPVKTRYDYDKPLVNVPIDFVSNGKPTSVYGYSANADSRVVTLDKGPYVFNGNPFSFYLLGPNGAFPHQAFRYSSYSNRPESYY